MDLLVIGAWLFSLVVCGAEAYHERAWPRGTFGYFAVLTLYLFGWFIVVQ